MSANSTDAGSSTPFDRNSFNPYNQTIVLRDSNGDQFSVDTADVMDWYLYGIQTCINYGAQLGASLILLIAVVLLTKPDKRRSPIFLLNGFTLGLNFIRLVMASTYFTSSLSDFFIFMSEEFDLASKSASHVSMTHTIMGLIEWILIETSLALQVQVVCINLKKIYRMTILGTSCLIGIIVMGFQLTYCVHVIQGIANLVPTSELWLQEGVLVVTTASIFWFCAAFVTKLGLALRSRHKLGLRTFGPMQVLFIMGCQTMIIPAIFAILQIVDIGVPNMDSLVLTVVALSLPLSSLWAAQSVENREQSLTPRHKSYGTSSSGSRNNSFASHWKRRFFSLTNSASTNSTYVASTAGTSKSRDTNTDLERNSPNGIVVDKSFELSSK